MTGRLPASAAALARLNSASNGISALPPILFIEAADGALRKLCEPQYFFEPALLAPQISYDCTLALAGEPLVSDHILRSHAPGGMPERSLAAVCHAGL
ncbi:MAG: hypothetical protein NVS1B6_17580 [Steroidobacteraceae bacterium]